MPQPRVVAIGEVMVEAAFDGRRAPRFAGDTFNAAVYLSRLGAQVAYATVLGAGDPFTRGIEALMDDEGLSRALVAHAPGRLPGLYLIETDAAGERRFHYWRGEAPVREFAARVDRAALASAIAEADLVLLSGITLAVVGQEGRDLLAQLTATAPTALDLNYRARLWSDVAAARSAVAPFAARAAFLFAGDEDTEGLYGAAVGSLETRFPVAAEQVLRHADGRITVRAPHGRLELPAGPRVPAVDATGAGDSFDAAYLYARLAGRPPEAAVSAGRALAARVVQRPGAIIPREA